MIKKILKEGGGRWENYSRERRQFGRRKGDLRRNEEGTRKGKERGRKREQSEEMRRF